MNGKIGEHGVNDWHHLLAICNFSLVPLRHPMATFKNDVKSDIAIADID